MRNKKNTYSSALA